MFLLALATCLVASVVAVGPSVQASVPSWKPTWLLNQSTIFMPCNTTGSEPVPMDPVEAARWGIADFDWSNGLDAWLAKAPNCNPEELLLSQAQAVHAQSTTGHVWVYRNAIKAESWFTSIRTKMEDRSYWNWFLPIAGCGPPNYECGANFSDNFYSKPDVGNGRWCGLGIACAEYLFDLRNESLRAWLAGERSYFTL